MTPSELSFSWTPSARKPGTGVLRIDAKRSSTTYIVTLSEFEHHREYRMVKVDEGTDPEKESYSVVVSKFGSVCDCKGFMFGQGYPRTCRHCRAVEVIGTGQPVS